MNKSAINKKYIDKKCDGCNINGVYNRYFERYICKNCGEKNNNYVLVTKTNAKKNFLLSEDDLDNITPFDGKCKSSYGPATYFIKNNLINYACNKHDIDQYNLDKKINQIITEKNNKKKINKLKKEEINKELVIKRKKKLILNLKKNNLEFRSDSMLYKKYIDGDKENSLEYIIERMSQMKYLYEYCHMNDCKSIAYDAYYEELNAGYFPDCSISDHAEYLALTKYSNGKYPNEYPWQTNIII